MATHTAHNDNHCFYFVTFTNHKWLPLIERSNAYDYIRSSFTHLEKAGCEVFGYVIMPNHLHLLLFVNESCKSLNKAIANFKRFMAYEIVKKLKLYAKVSLLDLLRSGVEKNETAAGKKHKVFILSFDGKIVEGKKAVLRVLDYIHHNPVNGKWSLVGDYKQYPYSSAAYYELNQADPYLVKDFRELIGE
jgi:REP element-mobilizing transposase RayT